MSRPEDLRIITEKTLCELVADESLKQRILQKAAGQQKTTPKRVLRTVPVLCSVLALLIITLLSLNTIQPIHSAGPGAINAFTAGETVSPDASVIPLFFDPDSSARIVWDDIGTVTDPQLCSRLVSVLKDRSEAVTRNNTSAQRRIDIITKDGMEYSFKADEPYLIDNEGNCWSCPQFFDEMNDMLQ